MRVLHYRPNKRSAASFNLLFLRLIVIFAEGKLQLLLRIRCPSFSVVIIIIVLHAIHLHLQSSSPSPFCIVMLSKRGGFAHSFIMNCGINSRDLLLSTTIGTTTIHHHMTTSGSLTVCGIYSCGGSSFDGVKPPLAV